MSPSVGFQARVASNTYRMPVLIHMRRECLFVSEDVLPADGTSAARCNDRDFGTSRWQIR
jgi:hypothetical protein